MVQWETTFQVECLYPVTGETVDNIDVSLRVDQQVSIVIDCNKNPNFLDDVYSGQQKMSVELPIAKGGAGYMISFSRDLRP